ncbi:MAG TPA: glutamate racemase, partial [Flavobacterium sp.]|nr:glutamate racemase [Flavobacterium sp.]
FLLEQGCKLIVVACNTATTNAIKELREKYDVPFIGIEPAIKPAAVHTKTQTIGVLATKGTLTSELFHKTVSNLKDINVIEQVGYNLVTLIEEGKLESDEVRELLKAYLQPMIDANIDYLVLGCSHYPYLVPQIKKILPEGVKIIDSGEAVARQTKNVLDMFGLLNQSVHNTTQIFYTNTNPTVLETILGDRYEVIQRDF